MPVTKKLVTKKKGLDLPPGFDWKIASRPGGLDLITLADRLNSGLTWPKCSRQEEAKRKKMSNEVRERVAREVRSVLEAMQDPSGSPRPLVNLIAKINNLKLQGNWSVSQSVRMRISEEEVIPIDPKALKIGGNYWLVESSFGWSQNPLEKWSYLLVLQMFCRPLISALETGEFKRLRMCKRKECQKFFVAEDLRRDFCSDQCRNTFNNKQRLADNYFTNLRHNKRKRNIQKARRLLKEGKPLEEISMETRLSIRVLKQAGVIDG